MKEGNNDMALIVPDRFERINKESNRVHKTVNATFTEFICNDEKYFQIDTFGSDDRQIKGKVSQSFQISENSLREIIKKLGVR